MRSEQRVGGGGGGDGGGTGTAAASCVARDSARRCRVPSRGRHDPVYSWRRRDGRGGKSNCPTSPLTRCTCRSSTSCLIAVATNGPRGCVSLTPERAGRSRKTVLLTKNDGRHRLRTWPRDEVRGRLTDRWAGGRADRQTCGQTWTGLGRTRSSSPAKRWEQRPCHMQWRQTHEMVCIFKGLGGRQVTCVHVCGSTEMVAMQGGAFSPFSSDWCSKTLIVSNTRIKMRAKRLQTGAMRQTKKRCLVLSVTSFFFSLLLHHLHPLLFASRSCRRSLPTPFTPVQNNFPSHRLPS